MEKSEGYKFSKSLTKPDPDAYDLQLAEKRKIVEDRFADLAPPRLDVYKSQPIHYRMR